MKLPGHRIVKTTVSVFLTAYICVLLDWPPVFAVITAIVTLEPTVADSIKKGIIRFPASAIGSFYAVLFIAIFGNSPITYTLAASLTIITCYQLRLHAGLLVATITAVAMVEVIYDNYLLSFFIRLGTTTTGIVVSTLVNMFIFPPNYTKEIHKNMKQIYYDIGSALKNLASPENESLVTQIDKLHHKIDKTNELIKFQKNQTVFQTSIISKKETFQVADQEVDQLHLVHYHLSNIADISFNKLTFSEENMEIIHQAIIELATLLQGRNTTGLYNHELKLRELLDLFWNNPHPAYKEEEEELPHELTLLYELITMFYIVKQLDI